MLSREDMLAQAMQLRMQPGTKDSLKDIFKQITEETVAPIIGNGVGNEKIFDWYFKSDSQENKDGDVSQLTVDEELSQLWARILKYPLADSTNLARVALYNRVKSSKDSEAKANYLYFLKNVLLFIARTDTSVAHLVPELEQVADRRSFSYLVNELDYPRLVPDDKNPLRCLARIPFPLYITTSYYDFLERALEAENRPPRTQVCFWQKELTPDEEAKRKAQNNTDLDKDSPVVFHLFGFERYPSTIVLSEGDYLEYLMRIIQDTDNLNPIIPNYLKPFLKKLSVILLGYRLQDWDFRVLFRLLSSSETRDRDYSLLVQLSPEEIARDLKPEDAREFLQKYFEDTFTIRWGDSDEFIYKMCGDYQKWTQGKS